MSSSKKIAEELDKKISVQKKKTNAANTTKATDQEIIRKATKPGAGSESIARYMDRVVENRREKQRTGAAQTKFDVQNTIAKNESALKDAEKYAGVVPKLYNKGYGQGRINRLNQITEELQQIRQGENASAWEEYIQQMLNRAQTGRNEIVLAREKAPTSLDPYTNRANKVRGKDSAGVQKLIDEINAGGQTGEDSDLQYYMEQLERLKQQEQEQEYLKRGTPTISDAEGMGERGALRSAWKFEDGTIAPNMGGYRNYQGMAGSGVSAEDIQKQRELKRDAAWYGQKIAQLDREAKNAQFDEPRVQDELLQGEDPFATIRTAANDAAYEAEMRANKGYSEIPEGLAERYEQMQEGQKANSQTLADLQERMEAGRKAYATDPANFRELTQAEADYQAWMYKYMLENAQTTQEVDAILDSIASQRVIAEKRQDWDAVERYEGLQEMANQAVETAWNRMKGEEYARIAQNEDYGEYGYKSTWNGSALDFGMDRTYEIVNQNQDLISALELSGDVSGGSGLTAEEQAARFMTQEERAMYNYLYASPEYGKQAAEEYLEYLRKDHLNAMLEKSKLEKAEALRASGALGNIASSVASVGANIVSGVGAIDIAAQNVKKWITGDKAPIDYNSPYQYASKYTQQTRENTAAELNAKGTIDIPILGETGLGQLYQIGMSMADSLAARAVTGGTKASTWILGGSAATAGMQDAKERGADDVTALILGGLNGAFEKLFEDLSLDKLIKMKDPGTIKAALGNIVKQMGIEASEEMFTTIANTIADELVMADKSEMAETAKALMEQGYTKAEAEAEAKRQWLQNFLWDGIGGAISGGFMAGGQQAAQSIQTGAENRKTGGKIISEKNAEALWSIAKGMNEGSEARAAAEKIGEAGKASASQVGEVYRKTISELGEKYSGALKTSVARDAANRLTELGETQNARAVADAIVKLYGGETLTRAERRTVAESLYGIQVTREMLGMEEGRGEAWANRSYAGNLQETEKTMGSVRALTNGRNKGEAAEKASTAAARAETAAQKLRYAEEAEKSDGLTAIGDVRGKITDIDEKGNITITAEDGQEATAKLADADYPSREAAILAAGAQEFGTDGAAIYGLWQPSQQAGAYLDAAERAYQAGQAGRTKYESGVLSPAQNKAIYDMGRARDAERTAALKARLRDAPRGTGRINIDRIREKVHKSGKEGLTARQRTDLQAIALLAKSLKGVDFVIYESETDANGRYVVTGEVAKELGLTSGASAPNGAFDRQGRIWLDINGGKLQSTDELQTSMLRTAAHELTHYIRAFGDQQLWNQLKEFVTAHMEEMGEGLTFEEMVDRNRDAGMEYDDAVEETVANACEMMIRDSQIVNMLAEEKPGLFKNVKAWVDRWTRKIREAFTGIQARSEEARAMEAWAGDLQKIWDEALKSAVASREAERKTSVEEIPLAAAQQTDTQTETEPETETETETETDTEMDILPSTKPLSARDDAEMNSKEAKPFMLQHPEMQMWMVSAAAQLDEELGDAQPAEKFFLSDGSGVTGQKRIASQPIAELLDGYGFTYERIGKTLETILSMDEDAILRQHKSVKIVENVLDEMLEHGYQSTRHGWVEQDPDYIRDKAAAQGTAKFSTREPVEENRNLIAVHNMREEDLRGTLALGGMPMPSIAIVKGDMGHKRYGEISMVFWKKSIDPEADSRNKVYSQDAWTPVFPETEYRINEQASERAYQKIHNLMDGMEPEYQGKASSFTNQIQEETIKMSAYELIEKAQKNYGMKAAYLEDMGKHVKMEKKRTEDTPGFRKDMAPQYQQIIELMGDDIYSFRTQPMKEVYEKYGERIAEIVGKKGGFKLRNTALNLIIQADAYRKYDGTKYKIVNDDAMTEAKMDREIDEKQYRAWLEDLLDGIVGERVILKDTERFDRMGNRKGFWQTHSKFTLENIVREMQKAGSKGATSWGDANAASLRGASAQEYKNIQEIRDAKRQLKLMDETEFDAMEAKADDTLKQIFRALEQENGKNGYDFSESVNAAMMEAAKGAQTIVAIRKTFREYGVEISSEMAKRFKTLLKTLQHMPTEYFEAKPRRAVSMDEVAFAVVPEDMDAELMQALEQSVADVRTYEAGNEKDRLEKLNSRPEVKFSRREDVEFLKQTETQQFRRWFGNSKIVNPDGTPKIMHHGTPYGGYTVFKDWQYFTENREYADKYQNPSASSIRGRYDAATQPMTYDVYLKVIKPFDTRIPAVRKIWQNEFFGAYSRTPLSEKGLPDWTDGIDLVEFIEENELDYDAIILDEGATGGYGDDVVSRGISVVVRSSEQVKSATDNMGTFDPENRDIRYSQRRAGELSDREILANAFEGMARNETELDYIRRYRESIDELNQMQGELDEIQSRMRERMYAKGPRGAEYKAEMEKDRNRAAILGEQIDRMDKKLLNFEAAKPLKDVVARQRAKDRKQIKAEYNKKLEQYRADRDEARKKAGLRYTIRRGVRSLDTALRKSVDAKHVPDELRTPVARLCQMFLNQGAFAQKDIAEIAAAYAAMADGKASSDSHAADLYDPDIEDRLMELEKRLGKYTLTDMPTRDLRDVQDIIDHFQHLIEDNNTIFIEGRKANLEQTAKKVEEEMIAAGLRKNNALNNSALWRMMREGMMRPEDFFDHIGGTLGELGKAVLSGETDFGINAQKARDFFAATQKKHGYAKWEKQKDATRELLIVNQITGETDSVKLTIGQAMSIYALNKREKTNTAQQGSHIQTGGIQLKVQADKQGKILKYTQEAGKSIALTEEAIRDIEGWLTNEQKAYADEMVGYLSSDMAELGNEVSKRLHGYSKFTEEYYFPYAVSGDFNRTKLGSDAQVSMLKNFGFTKRLTFMAKKPLAVDDFTAVCAAHVNQMLTYHAFAEAQDAFMRVYDYAISDTSAVKSRVRAAYGQAAETYIRQFMHDLYGGAGKDPSRGILDQWTGLFKAGAVAMNLSVAIQQPSAIARAFAEINPKYFLGSAVEKGGWEQLKKYAGTAVIKDMGRYDTGMGRTVAEWIAGGAARQTALQKAGRAISDVGGWAPGKMDQITWMRIWNAVKRETAAKTGLTGEALLQEAGKRFDQVTRRTQVYDSVLAKSQMMRSTDAGVKAATSFMAEPTVAYNMLMNAVMNRKKNPKGTMGKVIGAVAVASVFNVLLKSIAAALRDRDEDKSYVEKYLSGVVSGIVGSREVFYLDNVLSPATMLPLVKDVISIFQGYDVTMPWMSVATEAYKAYAMLGSEKKTPYQKIQAVAGAIGNMCGVPIKNVWRDLESVILTFTQTKPLKETSAEGLKYALYTGLGYDDSDAANVQRMLAAYAKGDKEAMDKARERLEKAGLTDKEIKSKAKSRIREMYLGGIGSTMAVKMLAKFCDMDANDAYFQMEAWDFNEQKGEDSEETYSRFMDIYAALDKGGSLQTAEKELLSRGYSQDEIDSKVKEYIGKQYREGEYAAAEAKGKLEKYCGMDAEEIYWQMDKWDYMKKNGSTEGYSKYDALYAAVDKGASLESAAQEFLDRGDSWTDIDSAVKEYIRDQYVEGEISFDAAADKLVQYYGSGDNGFDDNALYLWKKQADYRKETGESASSAYCYMYDYISEGNDKLLIAEINDLVAHGKKKSNMATSIVNRYESEYRNLKRSGKTAEAENLKKRVLQVCGYLGYNKSKAVAKWDED